MLNKWKRLACLVVLLCGPWLGAMGAGNAVPPIVTSTWWEVSGVWGYTNPKTWFSGDAACSGYIGQTAGAWWGWTASYQPNTNGLPGGMCWQYDPQGQRQYGSGTYPAGSTQACPAHSTLAAN